MPETSDDIREPFFVVKAAHKRTPPHIAMDLMYMNETTDDTNKAQLLSGSARACYPRH